MRALEIDSELAEAHSAKAGALAARGDYAKALEAIERAFQLDPDSPDVNREAGRLAIHQRRFVDAARHFERAFDRDDSDVSSGGMMITCYTALHDQDALHRVATKTLERAERSIVREPTNGSVMAQLYSALLVLGEHDRAKEWARRAMLMDPDNLGMRYNLACDAVVVLNDPELALAMLQPVFERGGREQVAWFKADPDLDMLRENPRCQAMIRAAEKRLGLASE
jgi:adenylate cyclase